MGLPSASRIDDRRYASVRVQRHERRILRLVVRDVDQVGLVRQASLLKHDRDLDAIGRRGCVELQAIGMRCRPALRDRKGREVWHKSAILVLRWRLTGTSRHSEVGFDDRVAERRGHEDATGPAQWQRQ